MNTEPGAEWYHDPMRHAQHRYWDGRAWTQWVATSGVASIDAQPLVPDLPPPPPVPPPGIPHPAPLPGQVGQFAGPQFRSLKGLTVALTWVLGAELLLLVALVGCIVNRIVKLDDFDAVRTFANFDAYRSADDAVSAAAGWVAFVGLAVFVLLIIYLFRASKNTGLWNSTSPTWAAGWTIGAWFIPVANLLIPFLVIREIWQRSTRNESGAALVIWWWILFVGAGVTAYIDISPDSISQARTQDWINLGGAVTLAVAAGLLLAVVRTLTARQATRLATPAPTPSFV